MKNKKNIFIRILSISTLSIILSVLLINNFGNSNNMKYENNNSLKTTSDSYIKENISNETTEDIELKANNLSYDNSKTDLDCKDVQCVIDTITKRLNEKQK